MFMIQKKELAAAIADAEEQDFTRRPGWARLDDLPPGEIVPASVMEQRLDGSHKGTVATYRLQLYFPDGTAAELDVNQDTFDVFFYRYWDSEPECDVMTDV